VAVVNGVCACKASCESLVREAEEYLSLAKQSVKKASATYNRHAIFNFLIGMLLRRLDFFRFLLIKTTGHLFSFRLAFCFYWPLILIRKALLKSKPMKTYNKGRAARIYLSANRK
jgi:hypothetical protein